MTTHTQSKKILKTLGLYQPMLYARELFRARARTREHRRKQAIVAAYRDTYRLETLIETGTYRGDMVAAMCGAFKKIYSIELGKDLCDAARRRFSNDTHIDIRCGSSDQVLPQVLGELQRPALFWLDAHYSKGDTALGDLETPIMRELDLILSHRGDHVVLIDDANLFNGANDYPTREALQIFVHKFRPKIDVAVENNIICICPTV